MIVPAGSIVVRVIELAHVKGLGLALESFRCYFSYFSVKATTFHDTPCSAAPYHH